jgi:hypothetical protein
VGCSASDLRLSCCVPSAGRRGMTRREPRDPVRSSHQRARLAVTRGPSQYSARTDTVTAARLAAQHVAGRADDLAGG